MLKRIKYNESGLIPCITQDVDTKEVLMQAFMNEEALLKTLETGYVHYFSRSKNRLWKKGESSGNTQEVVSVWLDCDLDSILIKARQNGVACHTGNKSCFFNEIKLKNIESKAKINIDNAILDTLYNILQDRKRADSNTSYTASLYDKGENAIAKKIIEEAGEFCFAFKDGKDGEIIYEGADLIYHLFVALAKCDINPARIYTELERRLGVSGIAEKASRV